MRENPFFNRGPRAGPFLTMILYRGADIGEEDKIPAGLKNGIVPPPRSLDGTSVGPLASSLGSV